MTNCTTKLPVEINQAHPKNPAVRAKLRKALQEIINSPRIGSPGHFVRWQVGPFNELQSTWGRLSKA
jgi:hypothetical protein